MTMLYRFPFWGDENVLELDKTVSILNNTKLYIFKWLIVCYVNFTSILKQSSMVRQN